MMDFQVLGSVRFRSAKGGLVVPRGLQATLLAMLLAHANHPISPDRLVEAMWGHQAGARATHRLQTHVYRMRQTLAFRADISSDAAGYRLTLNSCGLDAEQFESLVRQAQTSREVDPRQCAEQFRQALSLWRGEAYQGLDVPVLRAEADRLEDVKLSAVEQLYAAELACGNHQIVANELPPIVASHPLREKLHELLVTSHAAGGRQADALAAYQRARRVLVEELGIEPGPRLRELELQVLNGELIEPQDPQAEKKPQPAQLPARPDIFIGREKQLEQLNSALDRNESANRVLTVAGSAGAGKTSMALHWAHQVIDHFPDGQLYCDLRGFGPGEPLPADQVLNSFLRSVGVEAKRIPDDLDEKAALLRSETANRRLLIFLDNARDVDQVHTLLPGTHSSVVLITSRAALRGLAVQEGAQQVHVPRMTEYESRELVTRLLGGHYAAEDVDSMTHLCAHLPLALRIATERIRSYESADLATLVAHLKDERTRLDLLDGGDVKSSVRAVFTWSYGALPESAAWVFRCFGIAVSRELSVEAISSMADRDHRATIRAIDQLHRAHLVEPTGNGRFGLHDLLRRFAGELSVETDTAKSRREAFARLCDHYLRTSAAALEQLIPDAMNTPEARELLDDPELPRPFTKDTAEQWLALERENLIRTAEWSSAEGVLEFSDFLSEMLVVYLDSNRINDDARRLYAATARAARTVGDLRTEGAAYRKLGMIEMRTGNYEKAARLLLKGIEIHTADGRLRAASSGRNSLAGIYVYSLRLEEAQKQIEQAIAEGRSVDSPDVGFSLTGRGVMHRMRGYPELAVPWLEEALESTEMFGNKFAQVYALVSMTQVRNQLGKFDLALTYGQDSLELAQQLGHRFYEAAALTALGATHRGLGELNRAGELHSRAMGLATTLDDESLIAEVHNGLGEVSGDKGDLVTAGRHYRSALELKTHDWEQQTWGLIGLGHIHCDLGERAEAVIAWREALGIYQTVGHAKTERLQHMIHDLDRVNA